MKRTFLALSCMALALVMILIIGASLGAAQTSQPVENARPTPTPILPLPEVAPAPPESPEIPPLPDLIVSKIELDPLTPTYNEPVTIYVTLKNRSSTVDVTPGNNFWADLYVDPAVVPIQLGQNGVYSWGVQGVWLPAGTSYILEAHYVFTDVKTYALYAQVDTDSQVLESNEGNNVLGPVSILVEAKDKIVHQSHQDFQLGMASSLDLSHPEGVIRRGIFLEPENDPDVYSPDIQVDGPPDPSGPTNVSQVKPALTSDGQGTLFAVWEDGRNGGVFNRDIYFSRYQAGIWVRPDVRVNDDATTTNQMSPDLAYDANCGRLFAAWQDRRNGNFDIYFAYSDNNGITWSANQKLNDDFGKADQLNPSVATGPDDEVYVVWQDQRNGNDDVYLARSFNCGETWDTPNYFVTDDPDMTAQNQVAPSVSVEDHFGVVYVGWEDWRDPVHPEIYVMWSLDEGETFGIDIPVTVVPPQSRTTYRVQPSLAAHTTIEKVEQFDPVTGISYTVDTPVSVVHVAWQNGKDDNADVYYSYASYDWYEPDSCPWPYDFCFEAPQQISGFVLDSAYVRPPGDTSYWPVEPTWQGQVSLDLVPDGMYFTYCHFASTQVYSKGVVIAWSDGRSYDDWRYEIRTRRVASPEGDPKQFDRCEDQFEGMVNGNPKLEALRDDAYLYEIYKPAATGQANPSIRVDEAGIYVAWDDDRFDDPTVTGTVRNRDVFYSEMDMADQGVYVSPVIDGGTALPKWYVLSWWGATQHQGDLLFQTRFGPNASPPLADVEDNGWTHWTGNPSVETGGCPGEGCFYDAPGRHIVDPDGNEWFDCPGAGCPGPYRYMQYKLIIRGKSRLTAVSQVTIHYEKPHQIFLPIVMRQF